MEFIELLWPHFLEFLRIIVAWPVSFLVGVMAFKKPITSLLESLPYLLPGAKIKLTIVGLSLEIPIPELQQSIRESGASKLTTDQIALLTRLRDEGRLPLQPSTDYVSNVVRPLRNCALLKVPGGGFLQSGNEFAKEIEITTLGIYVINASDQGRKA